MVCMLPYITLVMANVLYFVLVCNVLDGAILLIFKVFLTEVNLSTRKNAHSEMNYIAWKIKSNCN